MRIDFLLLCGFDRGERLPDPTTICRFRNRPAKNQLDQKLLRQINVRLGQCGLKVKSTRGAIIDATIITSAGRPLNTIDTTKNG